jgi:hypothetical protein
VRPQGLSPGCADHSYDEAMVNPDFHKLSTNLVRDVLSYGLGGKVKSRLKIGRIAKVFNVYKLPSLPP